MSSKKIIIFDCDCTLGVKDCDVDDGLALLYLLGEESAEVIGVTATYGNSNILDVYSSLRSLMDDWKRDDIPIKRGGAVAGSLKSEAVDFLVEMANQYRGELCILATGSLTNLWGAYKKDSLFFEKVKEIVLMGGITSPLIFEKKQMDELNFSCDPRASYEVLTKGKNVSIITGNNCLKVLFTRAEYKARFFGSKNPAAVYIREKTDYWFGYNEKDYGIQGFYNWDVTAAVYLMHPELFVDSRRPFMVAEKDLKTGFLSEDGGENCVLNLPEIAEGESFKECIYRGWFSLGSKNMDIF